MNQEANTPTTYTWGTPDNNSYFNWALISWRFGRYFFAFLMFPFPILLMVLVNPYLGFFFWICMGLCVWFGVASDILNMFEYGRTKETARLYKEKPLPLPNKTFGGYYPNECDRRISIHEWQMTHYKAKRKAWRKERRRRWLSGNFRQFPMGDFSAPPFPKTVKEAAAKTLLEKQLIQRYGKA